MNIPLQPVCFAQYNLRRWDMGAHGDYVQADSCTESHGAFYDWLTSSRSSSERRDPKTFEGFSKSEDESRH